MFRREWRQQLLGHIPLPVDVDTKTTQIFHGERHVAFQLFLKDAHLLFVQNTFTQRSNNARPAMASGRPEGQIAVDTKDSGLI